MSSSANLQSVMLENRKKLTVDSVINVESFTDEYLEINTGLGRLTVEGRELKIDELRQDNGKISVSGEIDGIYYGDGKEQKGFFRRIFK